MMMMIILRSDRRSKSSALTLPMAWTQYVSFRFGTLKTLTRMGYGRHLMTLFLVSGSLGPVSSLCFLHTVGTFRTGEAKQNEPLAVAEDMGQAYIHTAGYLHRMVGGHGIWRDSVG